MPSAFCLAHSLINDASDDGFGNKSPFVCACEADSNGALSMQILKNISSQDKEKIQQFYKTLSKTQIEIMRLDTIYSEESEVAFINKTFNTWQELKLEINKLFESFETNFENGNTSKERSYFD